MSGVTGVDVEHTKALDLRKGAAILRSVAWRYHEAEDLAVTLESEATALEAEAIS